MMKSLIVIILLFSGCASTQHSSLPLNNNIKINKMKKNSEGIHFDVVVDNPDKLDMNKLMDKTSDILIDDLCLKKVVSTKDKVDVYITFFEKDTNLKNLIDIVLYLPVKCKQ